MNPPNPPGAQAATKDDAAIVWQESESAYKPIEQPLSEFLSRGGIACNPERTPLLAFIHQGCIAAMQSHAGQDILREQAGILCGQAYLDPGGQLYIEVATAVAVETVNTASNFRFHQKSWQAVWNRMGRDANILGWYHSHPGMGIFLSATDLRTQQLYFGTAWQIAVVLDPVSRELGVFCGDKRIEPVTIIANNV
jgi:proteasome lid subunit RPN8/RPN11